MRLSTIQQHEPLRSPSSWNAEERRFIAQLEEIFDDIYRRFGRLKLSDMGDELKKWFEDADGNFSGISESIEEIELTVGNKYDKVSSIDITSDGIEITGGKYVKIMSGQNTAILLDENGIDMQTAGKVFMHAKDATASSIIFGTDPSNANFSVGLNGDVTAKSVSADQFLVGGASLPGIVVSETQPSGQGIIWIKPSSTTEKQWSHTPNSRAIDVDDGGGWYHKDFEIAYNAADYLSGDLFYGTMARYYVYAMAGNAANITVRAKLKNGSSWITIGETTQLIYGAGNYVTLNANMSTSASNVMDVAGGDFTLRLECNYNPGRGRLDGNDLILKAKTSSSAGVSSCSVFYLT